MHLIRIAFNDRHCILDEVRTLVTMSHFVSSVRTLYLVFSYTNIYKSIKCIYMCLYFENSDGITM